MFYNITVFTVFDPIIATLWASETSLKIVYSKLNGTVYIHFITYHEQLSDYVIINHFKEVSFIKILYSQTSP